MSDLRFDEVVDTSRMIGRCGKYATATCKTCSERQRVTREEFELEGWKTLTDNGWEPSVPAGFSEDVMEYVAGMRAWNCCHEGEEPLDGFPEEPDVGIEFGE